MVVRRAGTSMTGYLASKGRQAPAKSVRSPVGQMTVNALIVAYVEFADVYYRKNGQPTGEYDSIRYSLKPLRKLYGPVGLREFGPLALKNVREEMISRCAFQGDSGTSKTLPRRLKNRSRECTLALAISRGACIVWNSKWSSSSCNNDFPAIDSLLRSVFKCLKAQGLAHI